MPEATDVKTHGITVDASREALWPWLVQMGCDRGGWYSWDRLDNGGRTSAERILPEYQASQVGDLLPSRPGHRDGFLVLEPLAPDRTRVLVRTRGMTRPWWVDILMRLLMLPMHTIMQRKQLLGLKARAEQGPAAERED